MFATLLFSKIFFGYLFKFRPKTPHQIVSNESGYYLQIKAILMAGLIRKTKKFSQILTNFIYFSTQILLFYDRNLA